MRDSLLTRAYAETRLFDRHTISLALWVLDRLEGVVTLVSSRTSRMRECFVEGPEDSTPDNRYAEVSVAAKLLTCHVTISYCTRDRSFLFDNTTVALFR